MDTKISCVVAENVSNYVFESEMYVSQGFSHDTLRRRSLFGALSQYLNFWIYELHLGRARLCVAFLLAFYQAWCRLWRKESVIRLDQAWTSLRSAWRKVEHKEVENVDLQFPSVVHVEYLGRLGSSRSVNLAHLCCGRCAPDGLDLHKISPIRPTAGKIQNGRKIFSSQFCIIPHRSFDLHVRPS